VLSVGKKIGGGDREETFLSEGGDENRGKESSILRGYDMDPRQGEGEEGKGPEKGVNEKRR